MSAPLVPQLPQTALPSAGQLAASREVTAAAEQFEALLIGELTQLMIGTVEVDGLFGGGHAEGVYRGMMAEHLGIAIARRGGLGLAPALMAEVIRMQGGQP
jgi:Rod binding domain-containing protein